MRLPKRFLMQACLSLLFIASAAASILAAKAIVTSYMLQIQSHSAAVSQLSATASTPEDLMQLQGILETVKPIIRKTMILTYAALPATLFILWALLTGANFYLSAKKIKLSFWKYILSFAAISAIPFAASIYLLLKILQTSSTALITGEGAWVIILYASLMIAIGYVTIVSYALIGACPLLKIPLKALAISVKRIYSLLPVFLILAITLTAAALITLSTYLNYGAGTSAAYNLAALLITISLAVLLQNITVKLALKHSRAP